MSEYTKYTGKIEEIAGWTPGYKVEKDDGSFTRVGLYEHFFEIGPDRYVAFPYWLVGDHCVVMSAAEVLELISVK